MSLSISPIVAAELVISFTFMYVQSGNTTFAIQHARGRKRLTVYNILLVFSMAIYTLAFIPLISLICII